MSGVFAIVRPYDPAFRAQVSTFLNGLGLSPGPFLEAGATNDEAAVWIQKLMPPPELLLIPYHQHQDRNGDRVDGIGALEALEPGYRRRIPILMPVSEFAWAASYPRRFAELKSQKPALADLIVPMRSRDIGAPAVENALLELLDDRARRAVP
jgi:hypothetical protein